jgi:hypothetical protein
MMIYRYSNVCLFGNIYTPVLGGVSDLVELDAARTSFGCGPYLYCLVVLDSGVNYILGLQNVFQTYLRCLERCGEIPIRFI